MDYHYTDNNAEMNHNQSNDQLLTSYNRLPTIHTRTVHKIAVLVYINDKHEQPMTWSPAD